MCQKFSVCVLRGDVTRKLTLIGLTFSPTPDCNYIAVGVRYFCQLSQYAGFCLRISLQPLITT